ncbi:hypothetical protein PHMEG_0001055 [Phytophthora megakarya]|uniref:Serine/threonine protein kinase n=1 Tax=Phytophthora megakarya TaxID=4795 RepID=A0A225X422_9STRA|nr:hypothetical protein PHMEG_0001055 [Phytophthora megakarya]
MEVPLLQSARIATRYCLPEGIRELPHVTSQIDAYLDTFSADWTIIRAYKHTESLRCVQYVAARELPETQDPFYKRWLLNRTAELAAIHGDLPTLQWLMEIYLPVEPVDFVVETAAAFGHLDTLQWLYDHHRERVHFGGSEMCGALEHKHEITVSWLWEHAVPAPEHRSKVLRSAAKAGNLVVIKWLCEEFGLDASCVLQATINGCHWHTALWIIERFDISGVQLDLYFPTRHGELWFLVYLNTRNMKPFKKTIRVAAMFGQLEVVKWLYWDRVQLDLYFPTRHGELWLLEYLNTRNMKPFKKTIRVAAMFGQLDVVKWLYWDRVPIVDSMTEAAQNGHLNVVQWLFHTADDKFAAREISLEPVFVRAAEYGHLDVIQWLHTRWSGVCGTVVMDVAASGGHFDVVQWLHENRTEGCSEKAMNGAAANGHFDVIKYLHEHRSEGCTTRAMDGAASAGRLDIVKWLNDVWCRLDIVKWLNDHRSEGCSTAAMTFAARNGHVDIVEWLHANRKEGCTSKAMDGAARNGHLDIVKWLHKNRTEGCTSAAMDKAARHGHLRIVKWLHEHRTEGCTWRAMDKAAAYGHLNIVKWLHMNRNEGCYTADAIRNGHFDIVLFLNLHREEDFYIPTNETIRVPLELEQWLLADCGELLSSCRFEPYKMDFCL